VYYYIRKFHGRVTNEVVKFNLLGSILDFTHLVKAWILVVKFVKLFIALVSQLSFSLLYHLWCPQLLCVAHRFEVPRRNPCCVTTSARTWAFSYMLACSTYQPRPVLTGETCLTLKSLCPTRLLARNCTLAYFHCCSLVLYTGSLNRLLVGYQSFYVF
jgi:hypothetical protein